MKWREKKALARMEDAPAKRVGRQTGFLLNR